MPGDAPKPCAVCGKPIRPDAASCWSCGSVFNTRPCAACNSAVRLGAAVCWFCGAAQTPPVAFTPEATEAIQPTPTSQAVTAPQRCPVCGEGLRAGALACRTCGEALDRKSPNRWAWEWLVTAPVCQRHRADTLLMLAIVSLFCCGIVLGPLTLLKATRDLWEMDAGEMDPAGKDLTRVAQVIAGIATALHFLVVYLRFTAGR